jgi:hypothetical protein
MGHLADRLKFHMIFHMKHEFRDEKLPEMPCDTTERKLNEIPFSVTFIHSVSSSDVISGVLQTVILRCDSPFNIDFSTQMRFCYFVIPNAT